MTNFWGLLYEWVLGVYAGVSIRVYTLYIIIKKTKEYTVFLVIYKDTLF